MKTVMSLLALLLTAMTALAFMTGFPWLAAGCLGLACTFAFIALLEPPKHPFLGRRD